MRALEILEPEIFIPQVPDGSAELPQWRSGVHHAIPQLRLLCRGTELHAHVPARERALPSERCVFTRGPRWSCGNDQDVPGEEQVSELRWSGGDANVEKRYYVLRLPGIPVFYVWTKLNAYYPSISVKFCLCLLMLILVLADVHSRRTYNCPWLRLMCQWSFFLNGAELSLNSVNSGNLMNHRSMNWAQFKDPVSHMCLAGAVVASWFSYTRGGWCNAKYFCYWIRWIQWKLFKKNSIVSLPTIHFKV